MSKKKSGPIHEDKDYFDALGFLGLVLNQVGGKIEIPYDDVVTFDASKHEFVSTFDTVKNKFVFELRRV